MLHTKQISFEKLRLIGLGVDLVQVKVGADAHRVVLHWDRLDVLELAS